MQVIDTLGLRAGRGVEGRPTRPRPSRRSPPSTTRRGSTPAQPGFEWLSPESGFAPPIASVHIAIKHDARHDGRARAERRGRLEVQLRGRVQERREHGRAVALARRRPRGRRQRVRRASELDANGNVLATIERLIHYSGPPFKRRARARGLGAGRRRPHHAGHRGAPHRQGRQARARGRGRHVRHRRRRTSRKLDPSVRELRRQAGLRARDARRTASAPTASPRIELAPTTTSGKATLRFALAGRSTGRSCTRGSRREARDWVLVGLTGGTLAHADVAEHMEGLSGGAPDDGFSLDRGTSLLREGPREGRVAAHRRLRLTAREERVRTTCSAARSRAASTRTSTTRCTATRASSASRRRASGRCT